MFSPLRLILLVTVNIIGSNQYHQHVNTIKNLFSVIILIANCVYHIHFFFECNCVLIYKTNKNDNKLCKKSNASLYGNKNCPTINMILWLGKKKKRNIG